MTLPVVVSALTASLGAAQGSSGLNAGVSFAQIAQTGGPSTDSYAYSLGGAAAGSFRLATANNVATLSTGSAGVAGSANGTLDSLTVTATDTSSGNATAALPIDVVVGSSGNDTITLTSLPGIVASAPTFIYGLGGSDTINAAGMTGTLFIDGGAGADTMTGGSGVNHYLFGAVSDSTSQTMDVITNFKAATDLLDFTGLGTSLSYGGTSVSGHHGSLGVSAHSIAVQSSGGNTYVYVNTSGSSESLTATNMKIELVGSVSLSGGNFLHA